MLETATTLFTIVRDEPLMPVNQTLLRGRHSEVPHTAALGKNLDAFADGPAVCSNEGPAAEPGGKMVSFELGRAVVGTDLRESF